MKNFTSFIAIFAVVIVSGCTSFYQLINVSPSDKLRTIEFSNSDANPTYQFYYSDTLNNSYLAELRQSHKLDSLVANYPSELGQIKAILNWANRQWEHNGNNTPSNPDALTILKEAHSGKKFRCVEYGIVTSAALNSIGIHARVLGLKTRDVEKVRHGAGHVVTEVFATGLDKWIFVDPQFNVVPMLNGMPLNAVEFQNAIIKNRRNIQLVNLQGETSAEKSEAYIDWVAKYLFYFDVLFDQRIGNEPNYKSINGMTKLMLVPLGENEPTVFQRRSKINYSFYSNSLNDFYRRP